jgi:hypothetical protein
MYSRILEAGGFIRVYSEENTDVLDTVPPECYDYLLTLEYMMKGGQPKGLLDHRLIHFAERIDYDTETDTPLNW